MAGKAGMNSGQKGYSNNPGGFSKEARRTLADFRRRIARMDDKAEALLEKLMDDDDRLVAATGLKIFFDRRWGKPTQEITGNVNVTSNHGELYDRISAVVAEARGDDDAGTGGTTH